MRGSKADIQLPDWREEHRYGIYTVRGGDDDPVLVACADTPAAVGVAIVTLGEDAAEAGVNAESLGVMDGRTGRWLAHPCWSAA
jgi:hypothetical protein